MENKQNQSDLHNDMQSDKVQENVQTVEVENDAQVNKAKKDVQINVRMKADTAKRFKALLKEMKLPTQSACIEAMIDICQSSVLSKTKFGQSMEQDIKNFAMHLSALTTIFNASIQRGEDVKQEVIADFKKKYADKDEKIDYYKAKAEDLKKQLDLEKEKHRQTSDDLNKEKQQEQQQRKKPKAYDKAENI